MSKLFPKSINALPQQILGFLAVAATVAAAGVAYYGTPKYTRIGYAPIQPVAFDHGLHAGQLGVDCVFCHTNVEVSEHSNVPVSTVCMACHAVIRKESAQLTPVSASAASGDPVPWVRIHRVPDYVFFNHAVHVNRGISCLYCHGRPDEMQVVFHAAACSMGCCLDCHRDSERALWPIDQATNLGWKPANPGSGREDAVRRKADWNVRPPQGCSGCHR